MKMRERRIQETELPHGLSRAGHKSCRSPSGEEPARWRRTDSGLHVPTIASAGWKYGVFILAAFVTVAPLPGQDFALDWFTIDGGGGTSTGGPYAVTGTIGQPDSGTQVGGNLTLQAGFWSVVAARQVLEAPRLSIALDNGTVTVSWPSSATGFSLEQTATLTGSLIPWTPVSRSLYQTNTSGVSVDLPVMPGNTFLRLRKP